MGRNYDSDILTRVTFGSECLLFPTAVASRTMNGRLFFLFAYCYCRSAEMDQRHDCGVLVLQTVRISVAQCVIIFDDSVAANFSVAKQAKEWGVGENLMKGISLDVGLVVVVILASSHAGEHEAQGVSLGNLGCLQPPDHGFSRFWIADVLIQEHGCPLHLRATQGQAHHTVCSLATTTVRDEGRRSISIEVKDEVIKMLL